MSNADDNRERGREGVLRKAAIPELRRSGTHSRSAIRRPSSSGDRAHPEHTFPPEHASGPSRPRGPDGTSQRSQKLLPAVKTTGKLETVILALILQLSAAAPRK